MDCSLPTSSVREVFQARILKWVATSSSRGSSQSRDQTCVSCIGRRILYQRATWEALAYPLLSHFSRVRLCATPRRQPTRLPRPWDSPDKNTGVGCRFLLPCMKVKSESESEVVSDPQRPHGLQPSRLLRLWDFPGRSTGVGCHCLLHN